MRYKCIVFDHDDTVVKTTPDVHYPSFILTLKKLRPDYADMTLEQFVTYCFEYGFFNFCKDVLKFSAQEEAIQYADWTAFVKDKNPQSYDGFDKVFQVLRQKQIPICVVSHSDEKIIARDYKNNFGFEPLMIFGWGDAETRRKPSPYPLQEISRRLGIACSDVLVVDDMKCGYQMAKAAGADFAYAGWSSSDAIKQIHEFMTKNADYCFDSVCRLKDFLSK